MSWSIHIENLCKQYQIGNTNTTAAELINKKLKQIFLFSDLRKRNKLPANKETSSSIAQEGRTVIDPSQLSADYPNHFWALKDINLEIEAGERLGIIGQNGCGKSTLLKILSRIVTPTKGFFRFRGRLISLLEIGTGFHGELTGRENIFLNGTIMGMKIHEIKNRLHQIIEFSELGSMIDTPVKRYSSGMYIRLAFAVAAHLESEILIIDEVLAVGDAEFQRKCTEKMLGLANQGRTLIFVSHDMDAVNRICNRAIRMSHGRIIGDSKLNANSVSKSSVIDITRDYLRSGAKYKSEQVWPSHSPMRFLNCVELNCVRLLDSESKVRANYDLNETIIIEVDFTIIKKDYPFNLHLYLKDGSGRVILVSMDNHAWLSQKPRPLGNYIERCKLYSPLLNSGDYHIDIEFWPGKVLENRLVVNSVVSFEVKDSSVSDGVRGNWTNEWPNSLIRPQLHWSVSINNKSCHVLKEDELIVEK
ncbi:TPA: ATP-binding cassette domain-containing protein [Legionella pneumophila]|nr:ABC transporter ATP-binding protein [Legionella pneumophila subsp. fraseri]HAT1773649.1 ATP-binding cassette domain-containing protein [Legionella pneumophila]MDX1845277.1 ABC transporter ATP-binding protein [Legionella pneumophila subsp. fraseri]HAT2128393.1 ATP-binding cassette domain-containing protein [Legionella pneumophila]HAT2137547.1 ATP-binding cassette domain-containing protein [Legionella pneumophila]